MRLKILIITDHTKHNDHCSRPFTSLLRRYPYMPLHPPYRRTSDLQPTISSRRPTSSTHPRPTNTTDDRRLTIAYRYFDLQPPTYYYDDDDDDDDDLRSTSDQPTDSTFRSPTDLLDRRPTTHH
ncbi:hypothetical protein F4774DRAFT_415303 [Daldinia eschscholtzii]|nr:hypothetical protein F4774DRAFT_415303 [Daldinia eschscholtzii]